MKSSEVQVFFSCSFSEDDQEINSLVLAIAEALGLKGANVSKASSLIPAEEAKCLIEDSKMLIAVIPNRYKDENGKLHMPAAVRDEINIAYGKDKNLLLISEKNLDLDGFMKGYATFLTFDRKKIYNPDFIKKLVESIHSEKLKVISDSDIINSQRIDNFFAETQNVLCELHFEKGEYYWTYEIYKKFHFKSRMNRKIKTGAWSTSEVLVPSDAEPIQLDVKLLCSSRDMKIVLEKNCETSKEATIFVDFDPRPEEGDIVEILTLAKSKFLNPIYKKDIATRNDVTVDGKQYVCNDGFLPLQNTKNAVIEFRFPREYELKKNEIAFFSASYSNGIDYIVESEIKRMDCEITEFGGSFTIKISVSSPLLGHMYGICWNPSK